MNASRAPHVYLRAEASAEDQRQAASYGPRQRWQSIEGSPLPLGADWIEREGHLQLYSDGSRRSPRYRGVERPVTRLTDALTRNEVLGFPTS